MLSKDPGIPPDQVANQSPPIHLGPVVNHQVTAGDQVVEVLDGGVAADESLGLVQIRGSAAIQPAELNGLFIVQGAQSAALNSLQDGFELTPLWSPLLDKRGQVHGRSNRSK